MTLDKTQRFAHRQGFAIRERLSASPYSPSVYHVCSTGSSVPAFIGTLRECYVFILGYCWNRGAA